MSTRVAIYRKENFNAAHRLNNPAWDEVTNEKVFGKCNNPHFHGHNYELVIKVTGEQSKSYVSINTQIEEKAPGGSRAFRWNRITSDGTLEQDYLKKLENILDSQ